MSFDDFTKHYTDFEMCNVSVAALYEDENGVFCKIVHCLRVCLVLCEYI